MVRDIAQKMGKEIEFEMSGGETELDRSVLETLGDPLIHLLRNAVDHGVETPTERKAAGKKPAGHVLLSARHERSQIVVDIEDDGKGIDPAVMRAAAVRKGILSEAAAESMSDRDALYLVFAAGLSTAKTISDVSGRGVGMDIVKSNIEKIGGRVTVESRVGQGTRFRIYLPLTLAIVRALLVSAEGATYALPLTSVTEMISLRASNEELTRCTAAGQAAIMLRGETMPLANLADVLRGDRRALDPKRMEGNGHAVIVRHGESQTALAVESVQGELEVVIKPLGSYLGDIPGVSGASILGDGRVALIVDASKALEEIYRAATTAA
jgi:two-component system chemotaxis sensor kinase CheA